MVNASVVLKWHFDDEDCVAQAKTLRDDFYVRRVVRAAAPVLLVFEVLNGIATASRRKRIPPGVARESAQNLTSLGIELREGELLKVFELAMEHNIAAYDAAYLVLANEMGCRLITGDRQLYDAVSRKLAWVKWIGDYTSG